MIGALLLLPSLTLFFYPDPSRFAKKDSTAIAEHDKKDLADKALLSETTKHANETHSTEHTPKKRTSSILESINLEKQKIRFIDEVKSEFVFRKLFFGQIFDLL